MTPTPPWLAPNLLAVRLTISLKFTDSRRGGSCLCGSVCGGTEGGNRLRMVFCELVGLLFYGSSIFDGYSCYSSWMVWNSL